MFPVMDFGLRSAPPCFDCDSDGMCTMNCDSAVEWRSLDELPDDNALIIWARIDQEIGAPHTIKIRRGMLSDRPGPKLLRITADAWAPASRPKTKDAA